MRPSGGLDEPRARRRGEQQGVGSGTAAMPKSSRTRVTLAVSGPASRRKISARAASAAPADASTAVKDRPDLDRASGRPRPGHRQRGVEVVDFDLHVATDHLVALEEWPVRDDGVAIVTPSDGCRVRRPTQLVATGDLRAMLVEPGRHSPYWSARSSSFNLANRSVSAPSEQNNNTYFTIAPPSNQRMAGLDPDRSP